MVKATGVHKIHSSFSVSGGVLSFTRDNASTQLAFGESATGVNVRFYGDTASAYMMWISASNELYVASGAKEVIDGSLTVAGAVTFTGSAATFGNASTDKVGFFGASPTIQLANVGLSTCSATPSTAIAALVTNLVAIGLITAS